MSDEIRVTLVATGLDKLTELKAVPATPAPERKAAVSNLQPVELEKVAVGDGRTPGYDDRNSSSSSGSSESYLDIPAFLRNQAD
jgi:hypothetical protein